MNPLICHSSSKRHAEFDLAAVAKIFERSPLDRALDGEHITSPFHLYSVETLRDRHKLRTGDAYPADVFVFGRGEPPNPDGTKIGGRPYWPADRKWPVQADGSPYLFLGQINFADSRDLLLPALPGDVLLLFVRSEEDLGWPDQLHFEWVPLGVGLIDKFDPSICVIRSEPFFGAIYRTADYPDAEAMTADLPVHATYDLPLLNATKIGGAPHLIQSWGKDLPGTFLCQVSSILAAPNVPYPWVNREEPLGVESFDTEIYQDENEVMFGDVGSIYIFLSEDGSPVATFECY